VVDEHVPHDQLVQALSADPQGLVKSATLFDIYKPLAGSGQASLAPHERSLAIRLEILDEEVTLTDERIESCVAAALERAKLACQARLRL
jgi:phenylalanyl-tRNA synthetase beta chain